MKFSRGVFLGGAVLAVASWCGTARASTVIDVLQDVATSYNVFLSGDMGSSATPYTSDIEGRAAIGGSAYFRSFSIAQLQQGGTALVVGNSLTYQGGTINGAVITGGNASFPTNYGGTTVVGKVSTGGTLGVAPTSYSGTAPYAGLPVNFVDTFKALDQASTYLTTAAAQGQGAIGTVTNTYGTLNLISNAASGIVYFNITASQLVGINGLNFQTKPGTTAIINVIGTPGGTIGNFAFQGNVDASKIIFNFVDATTLYLQSIAFEGTILAPYASIRGQSGHVDGTVIANSLLSGALYNSLQINLDAFDGGLPTVAAVPEASTWAMMMVGFAGLGWIARRRKRWPILSQ